LIIILAQYTPQKVLDLLILSIQSTIKHPTRKTLINIIPGKSILIAVIFSGKKVYFCFEKRNFEGLWTDWRYKPF